MVKGVRNQAIASNLMLLHLGQRPDDSNGTGFVKCFVY
jgi:hypothetical protein